MEAAYDRVRMREAQGCAILPPARRAPRRNVGEKAISLKEVGGAGCAYSEGIQRHTVRFVETPLALHPGSQTLNRCLGCYRRCLFRFNRISCGYVPRLATSRLLFSAFGRRLGLRAALRCPFQIQRQQPRQDLFVAQVVRPAVGGADRGIQRAMGGSQPGRPCVIEVGQRALLQLGFRQAGRVEPATEGVLVRY